MGRRARAATACTAGLGGALATAWVGVAGDGAPGAVPPGTRAAALGAVVAAAVLFATEARGTHPRVGVLALRLTSRSSFAARHGKAQEKAQEQRFGGSSDCRHRDVRSNGVSVLTSLDTFNFKSASLLVLSSCTRA